MDHEDQAGSRGGKKGKTPRETVNSAFHIRLTAEKVVSKEWITGSLDQQNIDPPELLEILKEKFYKGSINYEQGKKEQLHFQITVFARPRMRRQAVRDFLEQHYGNLCFPTLDYCEPCKNAFASDNYTQKTETALCEPWVWGGCSRELTKQDMPLSMAYPWQKTIIDRYDDEAPIFNSKIHWYWEPKGELGKTMAARFLCMYRDFYIVAGGKEKMRHLVANNPHRGYIINLTRHEQSTVSYPGLEQISDQIFADTFGSKMQGMIQRKGAHIIVFANFPPEYSEMSLSRWVVWQWNDSVQEFMITNPVGDPPEPPAL